MNKRISLFICAFLALINSVSSQTYPDKAANIWTSHFQTTVITQKHPAFKANYSGLNSIADTTEPAATSLTATLFLGRKLWKGATFYFNPEVSGGRGLSSATGVAGALNGETYRVGNPAPQVYIARAYFQQFFPINKNDYEEIKDDPNQIAGKVPVNRIVITAGKFSITDFFDDNSYSKDPRSQFLNWSLWANGAWDYPANVRGYTFGFVIEIIKPKWAVRISSVAVPRVANSSQMEYVLLKAHSEVFEYQHKFWINHMPGNIRLTLFNNFNSAPSYADGIKALQSNNQYVSGIFRGLTENNVYGGRKFGTGLNFEQELSNSLGIFSRIGWNDGKYATWAFTEIDRTFSVGMSMKGNKWDRAYDVLGIGLGVNGLSKEHRNFLRDGGYGFIIGDGKLNYGVEQILETFYNMKLNNFLWLTFDYQFVKNPAYNKDRGPVHVFGARGHIEF